VDLSVIEAGGFKIRVGTSPGKPGSLPLLLFNGIGASLELIRGFADEMERHGIGVVAFDVPGIGGSSPPKGPYRFRDLARLANKVLVGVGIKGQVDVAGVSWGGALAQEFTHAYPLRVRRLLLAATSAGAVALPGKWSALSKMVTPKRYSQPSYMKEVGGEIYGGKFRDNPALLEQYGKMIRPAKGRGYLYQLMAGAGWTSAHWLPRLRQQTLVMMGTDDPIMPLANGRLLARLIRNSRLMTVRDGHLFLITSQQVCAPVIEDFLTRGLWPVAAEPAGPAEPPVTLASAG
jgi:poly(3-hydroxyalkanoate) depolymerase